MEKELLEAVRHPLAFSAYGLSLFYAFALGRANREKHPWLVPTFMVLLVVSVIGGMVLYATNGPQASTPPSGISEKPADKADRSGVSITKETKGDGAPIMGNVNAPVNIHVAKTGTEVLPLLLTVFVFVLAASLIVGAVLLVVLLVRTRQTSDTRHRGLAGE